MLSSWFRALVKSCSGRCGVGRRVRRRGVLVRPGLEVLEERTVPSFLWTAHYSAGTNPRSVAVGDFNGDGKRDLAVANIGSNNVSILLGNGTGSFGSVLPTSVSPNGCRAARTVSDRTMILFAELLALMAMGAE